MTMRNLCPCCEYSKWMAEMHGGGLCDFCPVNWPCSSSVDSYMCIDKYPETDGYGLLDEFESSETLEEASMIARQIANLPANEYT